MPRSRVRRTVVILGLVLGAAICFIGLIQSAAARLSGAQADASPTPPIWGSAKQVFNPTGAFGDNFGYSVAISGNTAIVGSPYANQVQGIPKSGTVQIYVRNDSTNNWDEQTRLTSTDNGAFGIRVAISGDTAVVANLNYPSNPPRSAYVYTRTENVWSDPVRLTADAGTDPVFGFSVAISGNTILVGGTSGVYVFERGGNNWTHQATLNLGTGTQEGDGFGLASAIDGNTAVVGACYRKIGASPGRGAAYVFTRSGANWSSPQEIVGDNQPNALFGASVAVSGARMVIGAFLTDVFSNSQVINDQGAAYAFVRSTNGNWLKTQQITAKVGAKDQHFGFSVSLSGQNLIVGAPGEGGEVSLGGSAPPGAAYTFVLTDDTWEDEQKFEDTNADRKADFGHSVSIDSSTLIAGAPLDTINTHALQGSAYIYEMADTDGDSIPDSWERNGVTIDGNKIDLPAMGSDPLHKDIFIHTDSMSPGPNHLSLQPSPRMLKMVIDAFKAAPVENPDGKKGVRLHIDAGPNSIMNPVTGQKWGQLSNSGFFPFQEVLGTATDEKYDWSSFFAIENTSFYTTGHRNSVFRYVFFCNKIPDPDPDPFIARRAMAPFHPGTELLMALGSFKNAMELPEAQR
jgi:hypothetical protein